MAYVQHTQQIAIYDEDGIAQTHERTVRYSVGSGGSGKRERVTLTASASTSLSPPSGASAVLLKPGSATSLTLKGNAADVGVTIAPTSAPIGDDLFLPLGASPTLVITNGEITDQVLDVLWF